MLLYPGYVEAHQKAKTCRTAAGSAVHRIATSIENNLDHEEALSTPSPVVWSVIVAKPFFREEIAPRTIMVVIIEILTNEKGTSAQY